MRTTEIHPQMFGVLEGNWARCSGRLFFDSDPSSSRKISQNKRRSCHV